jgi:hypothetical protein
MIDSSKNSGATQCIWGRVRQKPWRLARRFILLSPEIQEHWKSRTSTLPLSISICLPILTRAMAFGTLLFLATCSVPAKEGLRRSSWIEYFVREAGEISAAALQDAW